MRIEPMNVRNRLRGRLMMGLLVAASVVMLPGCGNNDDDNNNTPAPQTIADVVIAGNNFTLLEAAVVRAGLVQTLSGTGPFTVFAPTDDAFRAAGFPDVNAINGATPATLQSILQYHVVSGRNNAASLPTATNTAVPTLLTTNGNIFITKTQAGAVSVNGARVTSADVAASNGVIHVIDRVLTPPTQNLVQLAQGNAELSFLVAAVLRAGTDVVNTLAAANPNGLTVFAPTNAAFQAAGFANVAAIQAADPATLTRILTYHVVPGRVFSPTLTNGATPTTAGGGTVTVGVANNAVTVTGRGNGGQASRVVAADILATNGVAHVIDRVLLP